MCVSLPGPPLFVMWRSPHAEKCQYIELILASEWLSISLYLGMSVPRLVYTAGLVRVLNTNIAGHGSLQNAAVLPTLTDAESLLEAEIIFFNASAHYTKLVSSSLSCLFSCKS